MVDADVGMYLISIGHILSDIEFEIIKFLYYTGEFSGGYTELTEFIYGVEKRNSNSNIRKSIISLESSGVVIVTRKPGKNCMAGCKLAENWVDLLSEHYSTVV